MYAVIQTLIILCIGSSSAILDASADNVNTSKWHGRTVYFAMTDRFAGGAGPCGNGTKEWCGGTLTGLISKLDYIAGMGFDALWITPVVEQVPWRDYWNGTGYHGYWARDFHKIESHLGSEADLIALSAACKKRGMLLMLDVVANHVGPIHSIDHLVQLGEGINSADGEQIHTLGRTIQPGYNNSRSLAQYIGAARWANPKNASTPVEMSDAGR